MNEPSQIACLDEKIRLEPSTFAPEANGPDEPVTYEREHMDKHIDMNN